MDILEAVAKRHSVRSYTDKTIEGEVLTELLQEIEKSNKLLKLTLDVGNEERTVASGLANYYTPEELIGKKVILVYNLKPAKLCGVVSQGMVLCAEKDGKVVLISPEVDMPAGSEVC